MAAKHVQYIGQLETAYREIRRLINTVWPLHGTTLVKRLRGEGRVKTAAAIGKRGGAVVNKMLQKYMSGAELTPISALAQPEGLPAPKEPITPTSTPETRKSRKKEEEDVEDFEVGDIKKPPIEDEMIDEEWEEEKEMSEEELESALEFSNEEKEET